MSFSRKTYADEIGQAIVTEVADELAVSLGLKLCQQGGLESLFAAEDLDTHVPAVFVVFAGAEQEGQSKLMSRLYAYRYKVHLILPLADAVNNPRRLVQQLRDIHDLFIQGTYSLTVTGTEAESFGFQDCQAKGYSLNDDFIELIGLGVQSGVVDIVVRASADPYIP